MGVSQSDGRHGGGTGQDVLARLSIDIRSLPQAARHAAEWPGVLEAIGSIPRANFCPPEVAPRAADDIPLPIGFGQTISQPLIVAVMTGLLQPTSSKRILEIGTGSGYQAAVLSRLVNHIDTVEIIPELAAGARRAIDALGIGNVAVHVGDGRAGWPAGAPYDGIIVTACATQLPQALLSQLGEGGRLVIPVGRRDQRLKLLVRHSDGRIDDHDILAVRFVPFV